MMDFDEIELDEDLATVNMTLEFYLKHRETPIGVHMKLPIKKGVIKSVAQLMDIAYQQIMTDLDSRSSKVITLEKENHTHYTILLKEIQAFHIYAPDSLPEGFEMYDDEDEDEDYE